MEKQVIKIVVFFFATHSAYAAHDFRLAQKRKHVVGQDGDGSTQLAALKKSKVVPKYNPQGTVKLQAILNQIQTNGHLWNKQRGYIKELINKERADPNIVISIPFLCCNGGNPDIPFLTLATHHNDRGVLKAAFKNGANPNISINDGKTPLFYAMNRALVTLLVDNGAKLLSRADGENTILHNAARYRGCSDLYKTYGELGADPNPLNRSEFSPLHFLIIASQSLKEIEESAEVLLRYGGDLYQKDNAGMTPLDRLKFRARNKNQALVDRIVILDQKIKAERALQEPVLNELLLFYIPRDLTSQVNAYLGALVIL